MTVVDTDMIANAFFFVAILLSVVSVPHIAFTSIRGEIVIRRHLAAKDLDPEGELTRIQKKYVAIRKDKMMFHKAVGEELERLGGMRNTVPLAIVSAIIITVMMFWPGFTDGALPIMAAILAILVACAVGSFLVTGFAVKRYLVMLEETAQENHHPESMYG